MSRKSKTEITTSDIVNQLILLLGEFDNLSADTELRKRVTSLVPVFEQFKLLGPSIMPRELSSSGRKRLLHYFLEYPFIILSGAELEIVGGIGEWARRIRELRVQFGWKIVSGRIIKEMLSEGDPVLSNIQPQYVKSDDYILLSTEQDKEAALRWNVAKDIRGDKGLSVRDKILKFFRHNVGVEVSGEELRYVAGDKTEWARRVRELRTEFGWPIVTKSSGRPDMLVGDYLLEQDRQSPPHDRKIPDEERLKVLRRDEYKCRRCRWSHDEYNRSDPRHLELHHIKKHAQGGENTEANLITLCTVCHDVWHKLEDKIGEKGFEDWVNAGI